MRLFYREYRLLKDTPELPAGSTVKWVCWTEMFTDVGDFLGISPPKSKISYTLDFIESKPDWFEGVGRQQELYPAFPSKDKFFDEDDGHYYLGEHRHNNMCRLCQVMEKLDINEALKEAIYLVFKAGYEDYVSKQVKTSS